MPFEKMSLHLHHFAKMGWTQGGKNDIIISIKLPLDIAVQLLKKK